MADEAVNIAGLVLNAYKWCNFNYVCSGLGKRDAYFTNATVNGCLMFVGESSESRDARL